MADDGAWIELHVDAWRVQKEGKEEAITNRGETSIRRSAAVAWTRLTGDEQRDFDDEITRRQVLLAKIATLSGLGLEPNGPAAAVYVYLRRAWDLFVARRRLNTVLEALRQCIPGAGTAAVRAREYLQNWIRDNNVMPDEGCVALRNRLGEVPDCRPGDYLGPLVADAPDPADGSRSIPNYLHRRLTALEALRPSVTSCEGRINEIIGEQTAALGNAAATDRYLRFLRHQVMHAGHVNPSLRELIKGLTAWANADTLAVGCQQAVSVATPDIEDRVGYMNNLALWKRYKVAYRRTKSVLDALIVLRGQRRDRFTAGLEGHLQQLQTIMVGELPNLDVTIDARKAALDNRYLDDDRALRRRGLPVLPWSQVPEPVGTGGHGSVEAWVKRDHDGNVVDRLARKRTKDANPNDDGNADVWRPSDLTIPTEIAVMYKLRALKGSSQLFTQIRNWRRVRQDGLDYIVYMDLCQHGDLLAARRLVGDGPGIWMPPEAFIWSVLDSLADAGLLLERGGLDYTPHELLDWGPIVHGDMKPNNVFLDENTTGAFCRYPRAKLADFGISVIGPVGDGRWESFVPGRWAAPEQTYDSTLGVPYSATNVWGVGMTILMLITGRCKRPADGNADLFDDDVMDTYSEELTGLIRRCLRRDPGTRPNFIEIKAHVREMSGDDIHDAAIGMRDAIFEDPRWHALDEVMTKTSHVPLALARDLDGDVKMVGGETGTLVVPYPGGSDDDDEEEEEEEDQEEGEEEQNEQVEDPGEQDDGEQDQREQDERRRTPSSSSIDWQIL